MTSKKTRWWLPGLLCLVLGPALAAEVPVHDCDRLAAHPEDSNECTRQPLLFEGSRKGDWS